MTCESPNPPDYTDGLGELIYAYRAYLGLSQVGMAKRLGMARRSYQRIETDTDACPPGLLDTITALTDVFDDEVGDLAATRAGEQVQVFLEPWHEWERAVAGRAAVVFPEKITLARTPPE